MYIVMIDNDSNNYKESIEDVYETIEEGYEALFETRRINPHIKFSLYMCQKVVMEDE